jgi:hypothetical protein
MCISALALCSTATSFARDFSCAVFDPAGDPTLSPGLGFDGEASQDILRTGIDRTTGAIIFSMEVAAPIPDVPRLRTPNGLLLWMWGMNTGPGIPRGFPLAPVSQGSSISGFILLGTARNFAEVIDRSPRCRAARPSDAGSVCNPRDDGAGDRVAEPV